MAPVKRALLFALVVGFWGPAPAVVAQDDTLADAIASADTNGDGMLQREEIPIRFLPRFQEIDQDGDGSIDSYEAWEWESRGPSPPGAGARPVPRRPAAREKPAPKPPPTTLVELIERRDVNRDGSLAIGELPRSMQASFPQLDLDGDGAFRVDEARRLDERRGARPDRPQPRPLVRTVGLMDTDGDGLLQKREAPLRIQQSFEKLDRNGDGAIDLDEARAADAAALSRETAR